MPPVRAGPIQGKAQTRGHSPGLNLEMTGRAEPCLTSGGKAAASHVNLKAAATHVT